MTKKKSVKQGNEELMALIKSGGASVLHIYNDDSDVFILYDPLKFNLEKLEDMLLLHVLGCTSVDSEE